MGKLHTLLTSLFDSAVHRIHCWWSPAYRDRCLLEDAGRAFVRGLEEGLARPVEPLSRPLIDPATGLIDPITAQEFVERTAPLIEQIRRVPTIVELLDPGYDEAEYDNA
jgi:hypothetical protein